jgi:hypothetical protein
MKVVRSLFLDDLRAEFDAIKTDRSTRRSARLDEFHDKLASLTFLDPACGCGNFLVITYRELRALELEVIKLKYGTQREMKLDDVNKLSTLDVDQMFGIEIEEFPARIAEVALWLTDHQANTELSIAFTQRFIRIPLRKSPHIVVGNALRMDWKQVLPPEKCSYILGNPPFVGKHYQNKGQREDMVFVFREFKNKGDIDYVVAWFYRAGEYVRGTKVRVCFVATNSITQGEQVPLVWGLMFKKFQVKIHFAHRTFQWESEARGRAHVHCVIIGFGLENLSSKHLYDYDLDEEHPVIENVPNISPYLTPGNDVFVSKRQKPLCLVPEMRCGNKPTDNGNFILTDSEKSEFLKHEPAAKKFLRRFTGSEEFINGNMRWCLWLEDATPDEIRSMPKIYEKVKAVREFRLQSSASPTRKAAGRANEFFYISQPKSRYILIPEVSSERRKFIPIGFMSPDVISANTNFLMPSSSLFHFGILTSNMHMAWVRQVGGRLESRYRYSGSIVYNNYPWPQSPTPQQKSAVEKAAQAVLDAREQFPGATLVDLYDPVAVPPALAKAHAELDRAVDRCYRKDSFPSDRARVEYLFALYEQLTAPLLPASKIKRGR